MDNDASAVAASLPIDAARRLADLDDADDDLAGVAISTWGFGTRVLLTAHGIVDEAGPDKPLHLTPFGRMVIAACAAPTRPAAVPREHAEELAPVPATGRTDRHAGVIACFVGSPPDLVQLQAAALRRIDTSHRRYRQCMAAPVAALGRQIWLDDPRFDISAHVSLRPMDPRRESLEDVAAELMALRLDPGRPPWALRLVDSVGDGGFALISKVHLALAEDASGGDLVDTLFDLSPEPEAEPAPYVPEPPHGPGSRTLAVRSVRSALTELTALQRRAVRTAVRPSRLYARCSAAVAALGQLVSSGLRPAPPSPFNTVVGDTRRVALVELPMERVRDARMLRAASINDIVLGLTAGSIRTWLQHCDLSTDGPRLIAVSMFTRRGPDDRPLGARMSQRLVTLPIDMPGAGDRLAAIRQSMRQAEADSANATARRLQALTGSRAPSLLGHLLQLQHLTRFYNLVVVNVSGPTLPLYLLGRRLTALYPLVDVSGTQALTITALPYGTDEEPAALRFGLVADGDAVPDLQVIADAIAEELDRLADGEAVANGPRSVR